MEMEKQQLPPDEERCCHSGGGHGIPYRCKNFRMGYGPAAAGGGDSFPKTKRCEKHYKYFTKYYQNLKKRKTSGDAGPDLEMEKKKQQQQLPPDEKRCCHTSGGGKYIYRCKNFRMNHGAASDDDSVTKSTRCEKHYNYFAEYYKNLTKNKKRSGDGEEIRGSKRRREKVMEEEDDLTLDDISDSDTSAGGSSAKIGAKRKEVERIKGSGELKSLTGIREPVVETRAAKRRKMVTEGDRFDDETSNQPATNDNCDSDTIIEGGSADNERKRKYAKGMSRELESLTGSREPAVELESLEHYKAKCIELSVELEKKEFELEKKKVECTKLQGKLAEVETRKIAATDETERTPADATECLSYLESQVHRKENENSTMGCVQSRISNLESQVLRMESENSTKAECVESLISKLESQLMRMESKISTTAGCVDSRISNFEGQVLRMESENSTKAECVESVISKLESQLLRMESKISTTVGCVDSRISNLESLVQRMENVNLAMAGCVNSRVSNLDSLVLKSGKESLILRCVELCSSERVDSEVRGLQNDITQSGEKPTDESNRSKLNAKSSSEGRKDSHVYECKTKEKVMNVCNIGVSKQHETESEFPKYSDMNISSGSLHLSNGGENIEEEKGWGSSSKRPSQHGSSSQDHLEMSKEPFANLFSDGDSGESLGESEDSDTSVDSQNSLGALMDMLAMKYRNRNESNDKEEMKWKSEPDMLSSFEKDTELCMKAVCALYRQEISEDEISPKGLFFDSDTLRCTTLAKFLMAEDCKGDVKKSVNELEIFDSEAIVDCKRLARRYSMQLFDIYQNGKDPFFLPASTSCQGNQTAK